MYSPVLSPHRLRHALSEGARGSFALCARDVHHVELRQVELQSLQVGLHLDADEMACQD